MKQLLSVTAILFATSAWPAHAQMVTGSGMEDFDTTFGISAQGWTVQQTGCSLGANVLWPGDEATFTFYPKSEQPVRGPLKVDVIQNDWTTHWANEIEFGWER